MGGYLEFILTQLINMKRGTVALHGEMVKGLQSSLPQSFLEGALSLFQYLVALTERADPLSRQQRGPCNTLYA